MTVYKNRAIIFGGVFDEEGRRHEMKSVFYNDMYAYDMERRRWFQYRLRNKKEPGKRRRKKRTTAGGDDEVETF